MAYFAASQDYYYTTYVAEMEYQIWNEDMPIFVGKAYAAPGTTTVKINVARRIYNWLQAHLDDFRTQALTTGTAQMGNFTLRDADGNVIENYCVLFNGKGAWNGESKYLAQPVNGHLDRRMKIFATYVTPTGGSIIIN